MRASYAGQVVTTGTERYAWHSLTNAFVSEARGRIARAMRPRLNQPLILSKA